MTKLLVKNLLLKALLPAVALSMLLAPAANAQTPKPVLSVSISGIDELMGDIDYLTEAAGVEDYGNLFKIMAAPYTAGINKAKPWGFVMRTDGDDFMPLGFIPVKDLKVVFAALRDQVGEPRDVGDGIWELTDPSIMYVKEAGGFAFIANESKYLEDLPKDPVALLGGLNKEYDIAVRVFADNVPREFKDMAIDQMREGASETLEQQLDNGDLSDEEYELAKSISENQVERLVDLINDADEITVGWTTDGMAKKTYLDFSMTAKGGSKTAKQIAASYNATSAHQGFKIPGAAVTLTLTANVLDADVKQVQAILKTAREQVMEEIENDSDLPNDAARDDAKEAVGGLMDVVEATIAGGKIDGGAALLLEPKSMTFVAGGLVKNTDDLEASLKKLAKLAENEPDFPGIKFNDGKHRDVEFHTMQVPIPADEEEARAVFGAELDVVIGLGQNSAYIAVGADAKDTIKKVINASAMSAKGEAQPFDLVVSLAPIFEFASSVQDNPVLELITTTLKESGKDQVLLQGRTIKNGINYRLEIEEGVIEALGKAGQFAGGGL